MTTLDATGRYCEVCNRDARSMHCRCDATLGTEWCEVGDGDNGWALASAAKHANEAGGGIGLYARAATRAESVASRRTNLRLTGRPLTATDLERIARCEVSK